MVVMKQDAMKTVGKYKLIAFRPVNRANFMKISVYLNKPSPKFLFGTEIITRPYGMKMWNYLGSEQRVTGFVNRRLSYASNLKISGRRVR